MPLEKKPDAEPIRGYRLINRLGTGGFGEVWKCEAPGGIFKAVKFVEGNLNSASSNAPGIQEELRAVQHIKSIRHPFLLSIDRVEIVAGELVIVTELADHNLNDLLEKYRGQGFLGLPRPELLGYLREAAEVLDLLNQKFDLQHLDVKPRNLFVVSGHVKVADFGLVNSLTGKGNDEPERKMGAVTPIYAAPEIFQGKISRHSDQYSLAIAFQELLTGQLPFDGKNVRQLLVQHTQEEPNLSSLAEEDRPIVARALAKNPDHRFASCTDFVRALLAEQAPVAGSESIIVRPSALTETTNTRIDATQQLPGASPPRLPGELFAHLTFLECEHRSLLLETWKAAELDGKKYRVQVLYGIGGQPPERLREQLARLAAAQHPALVPATLTHSDSGRLVFLVDYHRESLKDRLVKCQARKQPGIPRTELIEDLRAAAEVLDYIFQQHNVQHLGLTPRNLVLDHGWLQITDFGFAQLIWHAFGQDIAQRNTRYGSPELMDRTISRHCDQYSLALMYTELLTGVHPFRGQSPAVYLSRGTTPDLAQLPPRDAEVIRRALDPDPQKRWPNCTEMLLALEGPREDMPTSEKRKSDHFVKMVQDERTTVKKSVYTGVQPSDLNGIIAQIMGTSQDTKLSPEQAPTLTFDNRVMTYRFQAGTPLGTARERLNAYCDRIHGSKTRETDASVLLELPLPVSFWQRLFRRNPRLEIQIDLARVNVMTATPIHVTAFLRTHHYSADRATRLLEENGPPLLEMLQKELVVNSEKRMQDRLLWPHPVVIIPVYANGDKGDPIECRGKDISMTGMGLYLPNELDTSDVLVELPNTLHPPAITIPATLVRAKPCADGWYEVGALFRLPTLRKSMAEICI